MAAGLVDGADVDVFVVLTYCEVGEIVPPTGALLSPYKLNSTELAAFEEMVRVP